ncbi:hypothetical protein DPEC_G00031370 [Dallia pectoralis]|uniref:Uncharacterized protein n=1 Tax=Dallia pectoralis TaxID=75939 RepID=A0ACC2HCC0_DALPE|nr:hypothetical protein DPEC_G00031370 [Dallia pectoralis]
MAGLFTGFDGLRHCHSVPWPGAVQAKQPDTSPKTSTPRLGSGVSTRREAGKCSPGRDTAIGYVRIPTYALIPSSALRLTRPHNAPVELVSLGGNSSPFGTQLCHS